MSIRACDDAEWTAFRCHIEFRDHAGRRDSADYIHTGGEPEIPIGANSDIFGAARLLMYCELCDHSRRCDPADLVRRPLGEPEITVGTGDDHLRRRLQRGNCELRNFSRRRDSADLVTDGRRFGEPEIPVRPGGDIPRRGAHSGHEELRHHSLRGHPADLLAAGSIREPEISVRPGGDFPRLRIRRELRDHSGGCDPTDTPGGCVPFCEPEIPVRPSRDIADGSRIRGNRE